MKKNKEINTNFNENIKCKVQSAKCKVQSAECRLKNAKCNMQSIECKDSSKAIRIAPCILKKLIAIILCIIILSASSISLGVTINYTSGDSTFADVTVELVNGSDALSGGQTSTYSASGVTTFGATTTTKTITNIGATILLVTTKDQAGNTATRSYTINKAWNPEKPAVGYYADVDGNGSVDGVIFADLVTGAKGDGQWQDSNGNYTIPTINASEAKTYEISQSSYSGPFGTAPVLKVSGNESGKDRFYVMALNDFNPGTYYYWYYSAYVNMSDYSTYTSGDFGTGKANTQAMIQKWNASGYGAQNAGSYKDIWGQIQTEVQSGWFVPSRAEWAAFGEELSITNSNYENFGLSYWCWSSSQSYTYSAWYASFRNGYMYGSNVHNGGYVRLATTF